MKLLLVSNCCVIPQIFLTKVHAVSLTWALIELALHPDKQDRLRKELAEFTHKDPSYDQMTNELPYLDAVTREVLRVHPPIAVTGRIVRCTCHFKLSVYLVVTTG